MPNLSDHDRLLRRLETISALTEAERSGIRKLPLRRRQFQQGADLVAEGARPNECCLILDGMAARYKLVAGGRRQILSLHFSGDLPDLQSLHLEEMDHAILALTEVRAAFIPHKALRDVAKNSAAVNGLMMRLALTEAAIFRDAIANVGRRNAQQRIAHLMCEVYVRKSSLGLVEGDEIHLPMTQAELGDATGLSPVHVNRVLQAMRKQALIISKGDVHAIVDWERLRRAGDFSSGYLNLREL